MVWLDLQDNKAPGVSRDPRAPKVYKASKAHADQMAPREILAPLVLLVNQDPRAGRVPQVISDYRARPERWVRQVKLVLQGLRD